MLSIIFLAFLISFSTLLSQATSKLIIAASVTSFFIIYSNESAVIPLIHYSHHRRNSNNAFFTSLASQRCRELRPLPEVNGAGQRGSDKKLRLTV